MPGSHPSRRKRSHGIDAPKEGAHRVLVAAQDDDAHGGGVEVLRGLANIAKRFKGDVLRNFHTAKDIFEKSGVFKLEHDLEDRPWVTFVVPQIESKQMSLGQRIWR